jgi:hypothetical protein
MLGAHVDHQLVGVEHGAVVNCGCLHQERYLLQPTFKSFNGSKGSRGSVQEFNRSVRSALHKPLNHLNRTS